jgi:beta-lactamase class A
MGSLEEVVGWLGARAPEWSPGTDVAIAVDDLTAYDWKAWQGDVPHVSASSAKAIWVAAALSHHGPGPLERLAGPIFRSSDNDASGSAIDLIGPNAVNEFMWSAAGMEQSALTQWSFGRRRVATNSPRAMGSDNYFTAIDAIRFLARLDRGELLDAQGTATLEEWMRWAPRSGIGGALAARLPGDADVMHKAGWLPPGCCGDDASYNTHNELGIVAVPGGHRYAIAIFARRGHDYWGRQTRFVEYASCVVYRFVAQDPAIECARPGDPIAAPPPPPVASDCGDLDYLGRCDDSTLVWCEDSRLRTFHCPDNGKRCDWQSDTVGYNCL